MAVPAEKLHTLLGLTQVRYVHGENPLAIVDTALADGAVPSEAAAAVAGSGNTVSIDNFSFGPASAKVSAGTTVKWTNHDDIPHTVISTNKVFASPALDTGQQFSFRFEKAGTYPYYCSLHPKMTGKVLVG
jgi:plastocyanin